MSMPATAPGPALSETPWPRLLHWPAFQRTFAFSALLAILMAVLTAFIYWQTIIYLREQIDLHLLTDATALSADPGPQLAARLARALAADPDHKRVGGVFDRDGRPSSGNLAALPAPPPPLGTVSAVDAAIVSSLPGRGALRVARLALPEGGCLVFGRRVGELEQVNDIVSRALALAIAPLLLLACAGGALLSHFTTRRIDAVEKACRSIVAGRLEVRLPVQGSKDDIDLLSITVNRMLNEMEHLMLALKSSGDAVAHELRTPLSRLRTRLDRMLDDDAFEPRIKDGLGQLLVDVDQLVSMTRAVLRLGEIESGRRRAAFAPVSVAEIAGSVADFYAVIAEEKNVCFIANIEHVPTIVGDGDLLFEAIGNLVDNAIKFTPQGGEVRLAVTVAASGCMVQVVDTGPGIPEEAREMVVRRFQRLDLARETRGTGLGLSIVSAIMRLHGGQMAIGAPPDAPGCRVILFCPTSPNIAF